MTTPYPENSAGYPIQTTFLVFEGKAYSFYEDYLVVASVNADGSVDTESWGSPDWDNVDQKALQILRKIERELMPLVYAIDEIRLDG